jgi:hypothetical protein
MASACKIGAKVVSHGRYVAFQMAEVAIPRILFADILRLASECGRRRSHSVILQPWFTVHW